MTYFSEREEGERPRDREEIREGAWGGIRALIRARIEDGSFGASYPVTCEDGRGPTGCDERAFREALRAEIPTLWKDSQLDPFEKLPRTLDILDMIEFCWRCVGEPVRDKYHSFFDHYHLHFDIKSGRCKFRNDINRIFRRNSIAYELTEAGHIERLVASVLREEIASSQFRSGDTELDLMLETARRKFLHPNKTMRREALEALWDAWERLKTLGSGPNKRTQAASLLDEAAGSPSSKFRGALEREAKELTWIGNNFQIRHSETSQEKITENKHIDYLFHRLFGLIQMILRTKL